MPFAHSFVKCLSHNDALYDDLMEMSDRLKRAREAAGFTTAAEAADALGISKFTYAQHENGIRGFKRDRADQYARKFKVSVEWLLYGRGEGVGADPLPSADILEQMVQEAIEAEVTVETKLADLPRVLASNLHEQLERFVADPGVVDFWAAKIARDKAARSPTTTTEDAAAKSRNA